MAEGDDDGMEREMEVEALSAIFMDDLEIVGSTYKLALAPEFCDEVHVSLCLSVTVDERYPSKSRPSLKIESSRGLSKSLVNEALSVAQSASDETSGTVCVFEVASAVKAWLGEHNEPGLSDDSMYANMLRRENEQKEAAEKRDREEKEANRDFEAEREAEKKRERLRDGTPCTPENFLKWKLAFDAEFSQPKEIVVTGKLTGKQLFQRGTAKEAAPQEDDDEDDAPAPLDTSVFDLEEADDDLDDIDFDDEDENEDDAATAA